MMNTLQLSLLAVIVLIGVQSASAYQDSELQSEASSHFSPASFEHARRKRQARPGPGVRRPNPGAQQRMPEHKEGNEILNVAVPQCKEEGLIMRQTASYVYYVKCVKNVQFGGYYRVIHLCPRNLRNVADPSICVPPPDCSKCEGVNDYSAFNGLI